MCVCVCEKADSENSFEWTIMKHKGGSQNSGGRGPVPSPSTKVMYMCVYMYVCIDVCIVVCLNVSIHDTVILINYK